MSILTPRDTEIHIHTHGSKKSQAWEYRKKKKTLLYLLVELNACARFKEVGLLKMK